MKIVTFELEGKHKLGVLNSDRQWVYPLETMGMEYTEMQQAIEEMSESEIQLLSYFAGKDPDQVMGAAQIEEVRLMAPILKPRQDVICLGVNYMEHAEESARYEEKTFDHQRDHAVYFSKRVNESTSDGEGIPSHSDMTDRLDYEAELAVIIKKDACHVSIEDAPDYIFGYTIVNDVTARDVQSAHGQWFFGKSLDGFFPMGPCIVSADEISFPPKLTIRSYVNGEMRQNSNTEKMIFGIDHVISELSQGMVLKAGTIISMGTPEGTGMGYDPPRFLKVGDVVTCEIQGIGMISNMIV